MSIQHLPAVSSFIEALKALKNNKHNNKCFAIEIINLESFDFSEAPFPHFFWKSRDSKTSYHGWGVSEVYNSFDDCPQTAYPRFASLHFSPSSKTNTWENFPAQFIWKPNWCLEQGDRNILYFSPNSLEMFTEKELLDSAPQELPNQETWFQNIIQSKQDFSSSKLEKIVLARQSKRYCANPKQLFEELKSLQQHCYHFLFAPNKHEIFFGVSPERLLNIKESVLKTEALAGTIEKSADEHQNNILSQELFHSSKDQHEHSVVIQYLQEALNPFVKNIHLESKKLLSLHHVQHLQTPIKALLKEEYSLQELIQSLHPTPAVCGLPKQDAMDKISSIEKFDRGFYAGTMGIIKQDTIDFTVTIRSALWQSGQLLIWAGAGIVPQSDPKQEWIELNNKAKQFFERVTL